MTEPKREEPKVVLPSAPAKGDQSLMATLPDRMSHGAVDHAAAGARSAWQLAHAPVIELLDDVVGARAHHDVTIIALERQQQGPRVQAKVEGDEAIKLVQTPMYLPGTGAFDPSMAFEIDFAPKRAGLHEGTLELDILDDPRQRVSIPIRAWSREAGAKKHAEVLAAEEQSRTDAANQEASAAARADAEKRIAKHDEEKTHHHHAGNLDQLNRKRERIEAKMLDLSGKRQNGITLASANIGDFKRQQPVPEKPSLLGTLAWAALDIVTASVARGVSGALKAPLERALSSTIVDEHDDIPYPGGMEPTVTKVPPSTHLIGVIVEGVRTSVKVAGGALKAAGSAEPGPDPNHVEGLTSGNPKAEFISQQTDAVTGNEHEVATTTARFLHDSLLDTLDVSPKTAFAVMDAVNNGLHSAFSNAIEEQRAETFRNWIRYLTQTSVGSSDKRKAEDGTDVTDIDRANRLGDERSLNTFDGIVDIRIAIDEGNPQAPVVPKSAKIHGVAKQVGETLAARPLLGARVPVRAVADASPRTPASRLSVSRDEAGNLAFEDRVMGGETAPSRWLSRKAGIVPGSESSQREGARKLIEDEVMAKPLKALLATDSES